MAMIAPSGRNSSLRLPHDLVLDAGLAEQLERAQMKMRGARHRRAAAQPLDRQRGDAVLGEEHRGRQADQPATGDERLDIRSVRVAFQYTARPSRSYRARMVRSASIDRGLGVCRRATWHANRRSHPAAPAPRPIGERP